MRNFLRRWLGIEELHTELHERLQGRDAECRRYAERIDSEAKGVEKRVDTHEASLAALRREVLGRLDAIEACDGPAPNSFIVQIDKKRNGVLAPKKTPKKKPTRKR